MHALCSQTTARRLTRTTQLSRAVAGEEEKGGDEARSGEGRDIGRGGGGGGGGGREHMDTNQESVSIRMTDDRIWADFNFAPGNVFCLFSMEFLLF